jgi:hypothetical protein
MARRKRRSKGGMSRLAIGVIAVVVVGGFLAFGLPLVDDSIDLTRLFETNSEINSSTEDFLLPSPFALTPFDTVSCKARFTLTAINQQGQVIETLQSTVNTSPLFVNLDIVDRGKASTSANTIKEYRVVPKLKCDNIGGSGGVLGYFLPHPQKISFIVQVRSTTGSALNVGTFSTSEFSHGDLGDNIERFFPTVIIPASLIDAKAPNFDSVYDSGVIIAMGGQLNFATTFSSTLIYPYFIGQNTLVRSEHLISVDKVGSTVITQGDQSISILALKRLSDGADLLQSGTNKINSITQNINEATVDVTAFLRNFRDVNLNEDFPNVRILQCLDSSCNTNRLISSQPQLTRSFNGDSFRGQVQVPLGAQAGQYAVEVFTSDRSQIASRGIAVEQVQLTCTLPEKLINGQCLVPIDPEPTPEMCEANEKGTPPNCVPVTCEDSGQITQADGTCADENTTTEMCGVDETGTPPNCAPKPTTTSGVIGKIEYVARFSSTSDTTNRDCTDSGSIPTSGVGVQTFQLISGQGTCGGNQFADVEIRPIIDFGTVTANVDKGSVLLDKKLWVSVNNPFPASPTFDERCTVGLTGFPTNCIVNNHDFTLNTKEVFFNIAEFTDVRTFRNAQTNTGIYDIALLTMDGAGLEKKITNAGLPLKDGDEYSFMVQTITLFDATVGGSAVKGVIPPIVYHHTFNYKEIGAECDLTISFIDNEEGSPTFGTCKPRAPNECPNGEERDPVSNTCLPIKSPTDPCPLATQVESPVGSGTCITPQPTQCEPVPVCSATEKLDTTGVNDDCGFAILTCIPKVTTPVDGCMNGLVRDTTTGQCVIPPPNIKPPNENGGCDPLYILNAFGNCQLIGSGGEGDGGSGGGGSGEVNFCALDQFFTNPSRCFAQVFNPDGDQEGLMISGATQTAVVVAGLVVVLLIVVAVIVRLRRRGGFGS